MNVVVASVLLVCGIPGGLQLLEAVRGHPSESGKSISDAPGILHYLLQCGVKLPESVEQQMSSATPSGLAEAQTVEQHSTDVRSLRRSGYPALSPAV